MPVGVAKMSSSRIIKSAVTPFCGTSYFLEEFPPEDRPAPPADNGAFQPLFADFSNRIPEETAPSYDIESLLAGMISEEEAQQRIDEAYDSGFAEGRRQVEEDCAVVSRAFGVAVAEISGLRDLVLKESEDVLLQLAIKVAERIIRQEITHDRRILARIVAEVVESMTDQEGLVIRFNPADYRVIDENGYLEGAGIADVAQVEVKADEAVAPGGCLVETASGQVDGQIEAQLQEVFNQLMEARVFHSDEADPEHEATPLSEG